jgi:hypothetical protein
VIWIERGIVSSHVEDRMLNPRHRGAQDGKENCEVERMPVGHFPV